MLHDTHRQRCVICAVCSTHKDDDCFRLGFICTVCCTPENEPKGICDDCLHRAKDQSVSVLTFARKCPFCRSPWPWDDPCPTILRTSTTSEPDNTPPLQYEEGIQWTAPYQFDAAHVDPFDTAMAVMRERISIHQISMTLLTFLFFTLLHHMSIIGGVVSILVSIPGLYSYPLMWTRGIRLSVAAIRLGTAVALELKMLQYYANIATAHRLNRLFQNWRKCVYSDGIGIQAAGSCLSVYTSILLYNLLSWEQKRYRLDRPNETGRSAYGPSNFTCFYFVTLLQAILMLAIHIPIHYISCDERGIVHRSYRIAMRANVVRSL